MYFKIDEKNRVVLQIADEFAEGLEIDNATAFTAETIPSVEHDETLCYNPENGTFYTEKVEITEEQKAKAAAMEKKENAMKWLADNDWKVNKHMLGEWTEKDKRWAAYLADRAKARAEIDEAEAVLATAE